MFDDIPTRAWLLIGIAAGAYAPVRYIYEHVAHSPARREITQAPENLDWRTSHQFARSSLILVALAAFAAFIFTPAAERFANSPSFFPVLLTAMAAWGLFTAAQSVFTGQIEPFVQGNFGPYDRETQPKRFWSSFAWSLMFSALCLWLAFGIPDTTAYWR